MRSPMDASSTKSPTLSFGALTGYGVAAMPVQFMSVLVVLMYMKYALDSLGASASAVGLIFLVAKLWDAVSDPGAARLGRGRAAGSVAPAR